MRYSLAFVAAAVGSASATYVPTYRPAGYGAGNNGGENSISHPIIPTGTAYPAPSSSSGVSPGPSSSPASYPYGGETPSYHPSGTAPSYSYPSASSYSPHQPSGSVSYSYPYVTGTDSHPTGTGTHYPHIPSGSGSVPPHGSGSVPPYGSGSVPPTGPITSPSYPITTVTHSTGTGTSTYTITHTGTTTAVETITTFVPHSSPVGTASGSTYYSTYLTVSYHTSTVTATTTEIEVVCPTSSAKPSLDVPDYNGAYVSASSVYGAVPTSSLYGQESPEYPASTVYGPGSKPTDGTCPPSATTVYSTIAVTVTANAEGKPTACAKCSTYHVTLPNGHTTSVVVPPADSSPYYPTGSGTGSYYHPTGTGVAPVPTGSASNGYTDAYSYSL